MTYCYILKEADLALERQRKELERRKRLEKENKNSLQQTKDEIVRLNKELEERKKVSEKVEIYPFNTSTTSKIQWNTHCAIYYCWIRY